MTEIRLRDVPEQHVVSETRSVTQAELLDWLPGAMARVAERAREAGGLLGTTDWPFLERPGPDEPLLMAIYEGNPNEGPTPVEVCATVPSGGDRTIPSHREAYARVTKALVTSGELGGVYEAVEKWISDNGLAVARAPRETYWIDFGAAAGSDEVFDVAFPVS
ncbi:GyrI-like domain-containing protein [Actinoplanes sp. NPDC089786]|uniref:GyrI-like domain-containing protein n=1 Tax=Actinoplanes sp. NPDC089786 TaxID=3155185 RepID=UPI00342EA43B